MRSLLQGWMSSCMGSSIRNSNLSTVPALKSSDSSPTNHLNNKPLPAHAFETHHHPDLPAACLGPTGTRKSFPPRIRWALLRFGSTEKKRRMGTKRQAKQLCAHELCLMAWKSCQAPSTDIFVVFVCQIPPPRLSLLLPPSGPFPV